ncbi:MAG: extracellular solute-binding protein [bacterium]
MKKVLSFLFVFLLLGLFVMNYNSEMVNANESVSIWLPGTDDYARRAFTEIVDNFKEDHPDVNVDFQQIPWSEYFTKLNVSFAGGTSPDIFGLGYGQLGPVSSAGRTLVLNDYLEGWDGWTDIPQNMLDAGSTNGELHGILMPEIRFLLYRKDWFAEAGLDKTPVTTDELKEYARILTQKDGSRVKVAGLEIPSTNGFQFLLTYLLMDGSAEQLWTDDLDPVLDRPEVIESVREIESYYREDLTMFSDGLDIKGTLFENGLAAMSVTTPNNVLVPLLESMGPEKVGMAVPPGELMLSMGTFLAVSSETEHKEEAIELFKALNSKEGQLVIAENIGFVPTRKSAAEEYVALNPEYNQMAADGVKNARVVGTINPYFFDFLEAVHPSLEKIYYDREGVEEALDKAVKQYREAVSEN